MDERIETPIPDCDRVGTCHGCLRRVAEHYVGGDSARPVVTPDGVTLMRTDRASRCQVAPQCWSTPMG